METTAPERPEVWDLPALDTAALTAEAAAWAHDQLAGDVIAEARAAHAARVVASMEKQLEKARADRDAAAWTLINTHRVRRGADIPSALGMNRNGWKKVRVKQAALNPPPVADPLHVLPKRAKEAFRLAVRIDKLTDLRDEAATELMEQGWSNAKIARLIGRDPSRVSHLRNQKGAA